MKNLRELIERWVGCHVGLWLRLTASWCRRQVTYWVTCRIAAPLYRSAIATQCKIRRLHPCASPLHKTVEAWLYIAVNTFEYNIQVVWGLHSQGFSSISSKVTTNSYSKVLYGSKVRGCTYRGQNMRKRPPTDSCCKINLPYLQRSSFVVSSFRCCSASKRLFIR